MRRKKTTHIKARDVQHARRMRHRLACRRYRMRRRLGVRLNRPRVTDEELDRRVSRFDIVGGRLVARA